MRSLSALYTNAFEHFSSDAKENLSLHSITTTTYFKFTCLFTEQKNRKPKNRVWKDGILAICGEKKVTIHPVDEEDHKASQYVECCRITARKWNEECEILELDMHLVQLDDAELCGVFFNHEADKNLTGKNAPHGPKKAASVSTIKPDILANTKEGNPNGGSEKIITSNSSEQKYANANMSSLGRLRHGSLSRGLLSSSLRRPSPQAVCTPAAINSSENGTTIVRTKRSPAEILSLFSKPPPGNTGLNTLAQNADQTENVTAESACQSHTLLPPKFQTASNSSFSHHRESHPLPNEPLLAVPTKTDNVSSGSLTLSMPLQTKVRDSRRTFEIPDYYSSFEHYRDSMSNALAEEIQCVLNKFGSDFWKALAGTTSISAKQVEAYMRSKNFAMISSVEVCGGAKKKHDSKHWKQMAAKRKRKARWKAGQDGESEEESELEDEPTDNQLFLKFPPNASQLLKECGKGDLWILFRSFPMKQTSNSLQPVLMESMWHSVSAKLMLAVRPPQLQNNSNVGASKTVHALRGPNVSSLLSALDALATATASDIPYFPVLSGGSHTIPSTLFPLREPAAVVEELLQGTVASFDLNEDQTLLLRNCAQWFQTVDRASTSANPVQLVHGVFGSGKTTLLIALCMFLSELSILIQGASSRGSSQPPFKILVAAMTNVAVDRILCGLLERGFDNIARVGSLRKIAKPVLSYAIPQKGTWEDSDEKEYIRLMKENTGQEATELDTLELTRLCDLKRKREAMIIGVTCASAKATAFDGMRFTIAILDECSQMIEPISLLPLLTAKASRAVFVGDPNQLPPPLASTAGRPDGKDLGRPLFSRLSACGHEPLTLRTQYRCHPAIGSLASDVFYDGKLLNGVEEDAREPLSSNLPTLCKVDIAKGRESISPRDGSYSNQAEAEEVAKLVRHLHREGVALDAIGIISLYKYQAAVLLKCLQKLFTEDQLLQLRISTVDAFQGDEKDIIIVATTRTQYSSFLDSKERLTVAVTRARRHLVIFGRLSTLAEGYYWRDILAACESITTSSFL